MYCSPAQAASSGRPCSGHCCVMAFMSGRWFGETARGVQFVEGDLRESASLGPACAGCRYLCHVAADYRLALWDSASVHATNVTGTRNLMEEAMRAGIERVVYTSSVATLEPKQDGEPADETSSLPVQRAIGAYKQ